jgi:aldehyde dehydrogenase (NAD+)
MFAEIAHEIGLPRGVLNIVNGAGETGAAIVAHPDIDKIAFTGSTEVGRIIRKATAASEKKLSLELGGKSPFIVFDDADLDSAVEGLVDGIWFNQGQVCCAGSRLLVQERVAERLYDKLRARMESLRVGQPLDKSIDIGAIVDKVQYDRIAGLVQQGIAEGATCHQPSTPVPDKGLFYPPTLLTNVSPSSTVAQVEIFGPVLAAMTFRTPAEAIELANNTVYGLAASVWSENINVALDVAAQVKAGVVWVNATNLFDAACGFGGYRESGYGREGGKEGMAEYLVPAWFKAGSQLSVVSSHVEATENGELTTDNSIDRTVKQYIGGKQARPDSGYSYPVYDRAGKLVGEAPLGSRKDIRNAVEAARAASKWGKMPAHGRAQVLYFLAENLAQRSAELAGKLAVFVGEEQAGREVEASIERTFAYAGWPDKFEGSVHNPPARMVALAMKEPVGTIGILAPEEAPLLSLLSLVLPAIAMGNTVIAVPGERSATLMAELYQVLDTSDVPGGVLNLIAGKPMELAKTLAEHDDVDSIWSFRDAAASTLVKTASVGNLKQTFTNDGHAVDWFTPQAEGRWWLQHATQVKNIWVPYGE